MDCEAIAIWIAISQRDLLPIQKPYMVIICNLVIDTLAALAISPGWDPKSASRARRYEPTAVRTGFPSPIPCRLSAMCSREYARNEPLGAGSY